MTINEPCHEKNCFCNMRTTKAHPYSLISTIVVHCLYNIISLVSVSKISSPHLASVAAQAGLSLTWLKTTKTGFLMTRLKWFVIDRNFEGINKSLKNVLNYSLCSPTLYIHDVC